MLQVLVKFILKLVTWAAAASAGRIAALSHEILDHAVKSGAVVIALTRVKNKIVDRCRRFIRE